MLGFFRRYQRYFFLFITIIIVISFSFFGTYNTLNNGSFREQIAFRSVNGTDITRHELDEMAAFISSDSLDKLLYGGVWGPNFLNDGVIAKDFLETGMGAILAMKYGELVESDLTLRHEKEKRFHLYMHPDASFISTEAAWNYFLPGMTATYHHLRSLPTPSTFDALQARSSLYLMERQFPQPLLKQVLRYQEKQNSFISPDRDLDYRDLSLFGYHSVEDWFGPRFIRLAAEFIINAAQIAVQRGYEVSRADALASLMRNAEESYQQLARNPNIGVANSREYFDEQLRRLGMDSTGAAKVWRQVMLFRRLFQDMGSSVFVDPYTYQQLNGYALETVEGQLFRMPKEMRLNTFAALQQFEAYLDAIAKRSDNDKTKLALPTKFLTPAQVSANTPELVQKRYLLEVAQVNKKDLESRVSVKETWQWEASDAGWKELKKQFPEVQGLLKGLQEKNRTDRLAVLDSLDSKLRGRIDTYARKMIVDDHSEWLDQALAEAKSMKVPVGLHEKSGNALFAGLTDGTVLMQLFDEAPLGGEEAKAAADKLSNFTADSNTYYRIVVLERAAQPEILTFSEAVQEGVLAKLVDKQLQEYYRKIRNDNPKDFQMKDKSWKSFTEVKPIVADKYYAPLLKAIQNTYAKAVGKEAPEEMIPDFAATLRFYSYVNDMRSKIEKDPAIAASLSIEPPTTPAVRNIAAAVPQLSDQWKLERVSYETTRSSNDSALDTATVFSLPIGSWTKVNTPADGGINFFHLEQKASGANDQAVAASASRAQHLLSDDAQQRLMYQLLGTMQEKSAISLDYLAKVQEN